MTDQSREHAKAGQLYKFGEVEVIAIDSFSGCKGCISGYFPDRCSGLPLCSSCDSSVIFKGVDL